MNKPNYAKIALLIIVLAEEIRNARTRFERRKRKVVKFP